MVGVRKVSPSEHTHTHTNLYHSWTPFITVQGIPYFSQALFTTHCHSWAFSQPLALLTIHGPSLQHHTPFRHHIEHLKPPPTCIVAAGDKMPSQKIPRSKSSPGTHLFHRWRWQDGQFPPSHAFAHVVVCLAHQRHIHTSCTMRHNMSGLASRHIMGHITGHKQVRRFEETLLPKNP